MIDKINDGTEKNRIGFATTCRGIYETTFTFGEVLPCLLLESERVSTRGRQPIHYNFVSC